MLSGRSPTGRAGSISIGATVWRSALLSRDNPAKAVAIETSISTRYFVDAVNGSIGDLRIIDSGKTKLEASYAAQTDRLDARRLAEGVVVALLSAGRDSRNCCNSVGFA